MCGISKADARLGGRKNTKYQMLELLPTLTHIFDKWEYNGHNVPVSFSYGHLGFFTHGKNLQNFKKNTTTSAHFCSATLTPLKNGGDFN